MSFVIRKKKIEPKQLELPLVRYEDPVSIDKNGVIKGEGQSPKGLASLGITLNAENENN